jgi:hypothetical protein
MVIASCNEIGQFSQYEDGEIYSGKELKETMFWENASVENTLGDIFRLHHDSGDAAHTCLYFSLLRFWFTGVQTGSLERIVLQGCLLNLLFFLFSFLLMYNLVIRFFTNRCLVAFALLVAFLNVGSVSNTLFIRPYQLQETLSILMGLLFVRYYQWMGTHSQLHTWKQILLLSIALAFVLLSAYLAVIFVGFLVIVLLIKAYTEKEMRLFKIILAASLLSILIAELLYFSYLSAFMGAAGVRAMDNMEGGVFLQNLCASFQAILRLYNRELFYGAVIILSLLIVINLLWRRKKIFPITINTINKPLLVLIALSFIWTSLVMVLAPFKTTVRYIVPVFPLIALIIPLLISKLRGEILILTAIAYTVIYLFVALLPKRVDYLHPNIVKDSVFTQHPHVPVLIQSGNYWRYGTIVPYFVDEQYYGFVRPEHDIMDYISCYEKVIILMEKGDGELEVPENYTIVEDFNSGPSFRGYYLVRK